MVRCCDVRIHGDHPTVLDNPFSLFTSHLAGFARENSIAALGERGMNFPSTLSHS